MVDSRPLLITESYVLDALDVSIDSNRRKDVNPLTHLALVDLHLAKFDFSFAPNARTYALQEILVSTINSYYSKVRLALDLPCVDKPLSIRSAVEIIREDGALGNSTLIGWSWLYFHFVEVILSVTQTQFSNYVGIEPRTLRRYQKNVIKRLVTQLILDEQNARQMLRQNLLLGKLPHKGNIPSLFGREVFFNQINLSTNKHYHILGASGVGKSVFVEAVIVDQIKNGMLDNILWLDSPTSVEEVRLRAKESLMNTENFAYVSLGDYCSLKSIVIVIDEIESLLANPADMYHLIRELSNVCMFLISHVQVPLIDLLQIKLDELDVRAVGQKISRLPILGTQATELTKLAWQHVGGNPLAIELFVKNYRIFDISHAGIVTLEYLFDSIFQKLERSSRLLWLLLAIEIDNPLSILGFSAVPFFSKNDYFTLVQVGVMADLRDAKVSISAQRFMEIRYQSDDELRPLVFQLVEYLCHGHASNVTLNIIEAMLKTDWLKLGDYFYNLCTRSFLRYGVNQGHYTRWYEILAKSIGLLTRENVTIALGLGLCNRFLGRWQEAIQLFQAVVHYAYVNSLFDYRLNALLEIAIVHRCAGNYMDAISVLEEAEANSLNSLDTTLKNTVIVERIKIFLDRNDTIGAKDSMLYLSQDDPNYLFFKLGIAVQDTPDMPLQLINSIGEQLLDNYSDNASVSAKVHNLLGRVYQNYHQYKYATKHLTAAFGILESRDNDPYAFARTQSNLAALLIMSDRTTEALELLESSARIQRMIGDRVGMAVTLHNKNALLRHIVN